MKKTIYIVSIYEKDSVYYYSDLSLDIFKTKKEAEKKQREYLREKARILKDCGENFERDDVSIKIDGDEVMRVEVIKSEIEL